MGRITGKELVERWALTDPDDIVTLCKQGRLTAFSKLGESIDRAEEIANYEELCVTGGVKMQEMADLKMCIGFLGYRRPGGHSIETGGKWKATAQESK